MNWISVNDGLPEGEEQYLVYVEEFNPETFNGFSHYTIITTFEKRITETIIENDRIIHILSKDMDFFVNEYDRDIKVTHWMPLPKPPKEKQNEQV